MCKQVAIVFKQTIVLSIIDSKNAMSLVIFYVVI